MNEPYVQTEAFPAPPKTRRELAEEFVEHFQADVESAQKSLGNAQARLTAAEERAAQSASGAGPEWPGVQDSWWALGRYPYQR